VSDEVCDVCGAPEHYLPTCPVFVAEAKAVAAIEDKFLRESRTVQLVRKVLRMGREHGWRQTGGPAGSDSAASELTENQSEPSDCAGHEPHT
jgi:hypothetical protein